jgi:hypothetical protein
MIVDYIWFIYEQDWFNLNEIEKNNIYENYIVVIKKDYTFLSLD